MPWKTASEQTRCGLDLTQAVWSRLDLRPDAADNDRLIVLLGQLTRVVGNPDWHRKRGRCLMSRYVRAGSSADLDAAIADFAKAFTEFGRQRSDGIYLAGLDLSWARETRFDLRQGRDEDFVTYWDADNGVRLLSGPPDLVTPIYLLEGLFAQDGRPDVPRTGPPSPDLVPRLKRNLANLLRKYAEATVKSRAPQDRAGDVERAVELLLQALDEMPASSGEYASVVSSLIVALEAGPQREPAPGGPHADPALLDRLAAALEEAVAESAEPYIVAGSKLNLARLQLKQGRIDEAVTLLRELCAAGPTSVAPFGLRAAEAWALSALERGAWDESVEAHTSAAALTGALRASQPDWQSRYLWSGASGRVATLAAFALAQAGRPAEAAVAIAEGRALMLSERVTLGPGTRPLSAPGGEPAGDFAGTALYLVSTLAGSVALHRGVGGVWSATGLPSLDPDVLSERTHRYFAALDAYRLHPGMAAEAWKGELDRMLGFLSDALRPLAWTLPAGDITIVPTGTLALLPLGAALLDGPPDRGVSILPALSLRPATAPVIPDQALVIADPSLPWAEWERAAVAAFFPRAAPEPEKTSPRDVVAALPAHGVLHFACHGTADLGAPLASRLDLPRGGKLTVADVLQADLPSLALVVLSACETGLADPYSPDEGIGFPAAFLSAANASVLSTLWQVDDLSTSLLILRFYWEWRREKAPGSLALARAQWWQGSTTTEEKCAFVRQAVTAGVLTAAAAETMTAEIRGRGGSAAANPFGHPHHWAAFTYTGS